MMFVLPLAHVHGAEYPITRETHRHGGRMTVDREMVVPQEWAICGVRWFCARGTRSALASSGESTARYDVSVAGGRYGVLAALKYALTLLTTVTGCHPRPE